MSKLERLLNLMAAMVEATRPITRDEIKEKLPAGTYSDNKESFRRTFERDKDELKKIGIPILFDEATQGYSVETGTSKEQSLNLESDELAALHIAFNLVRFQTTDKDNPFWKLGSHVSSEGEVQPLTEIPLDPTLSVLLGAATERQSVNFTYNEQAREVQPHRVTFKRGRWYLTGYDLNREANRNFRVSRIKGKVQLGEKASFEPPEQIKLELNEFPWRYGEEPARTVTMQIEPSQASWIISYLGEESVHKINDDGSVVIQELVCDWKAFRSFALTFLDGAEILAPEKLRQGMKEWLESLL
ncbi:MAG: hypothetical protein CL420_05700 [Acidimicrobiaceae bacterium]|jgi:proteasome accessory factor B|nr:hypothetical protein [Acidimicrobiaceae bacterium]|tara:strand:- start:1760 stop:2662 length:903 start_codon:yes stop_codon:yes gene_type:complete